MILYLRNKAALAFEDPFLGIYVPAKETTNEGIFAIDSNDLNGLLRSNPEASSNLYALLTTGATGSVTYGTDLYISTDGVAGENKVDVGALGATAAEKASIAYAKLRNLVGAQIFIDPTGTTHLTKDLQSSLSALDTAINGLGNVTENLTWRPHVLAVTEDAQLNVSGPILISGMTFPLSDDDLPENINGSDMIEGTYVLYKGATAADDKLFKSVGGSLVLQSGINGLNDGYTYIVKHNLLGEWHSQELQALFTFFAGSGLIKISDVSWNVPEEGGMKSFTDIAAFVAAKQNPQNTWKQDELVFIVDVKRFVHVLSYNSTGAVEDTDWEWLFELSNTLYIDDTKVKVLDTAAFVLPNATATGEAGALMFNTASGMIMKHDGTDWESVSKSHLQFGGARVDGQYLSVAGVTSGQTGILAARDMRITAVAIKIGSGNLTKTFEVRVDGVKVGSDLVAVAGVVSVTGLALDVADGSYIQVFASADGAAALNVVAAVETCFTLPK